MRIIGGQWRGRRLAALGRGDRRAHLRPTTDRVRETLFNLLTGGRFGDPVAGARVLDAFAGTGALGLEALSRGAAEAVFLDTGRAARGLIRQNIAALGAEGRARLIPRDATRPGAWAEAPFDLAFLDPPYGKGLGERALAALSAGGWLAPGALAVCEEGTPLQPVPGFALLEARGVGNSLLHLLRHEGAGA